jgi:hypothetical protein
MNKKEAAEFLGVSTRLIERYASQGRLKVTYVRGKTGRESSFDQSDLESLKGELEAPAHKATIAPNTPALETVGALVPAVREQQNRLMNALESIARNQPNGQNRADVAIESKPLLKLKEAQALTGLGREVLIEAIEGGKLQVAKRNNPRAPYRIKRSALDAYIEKSF